MTAAEPLTDDMIRAIQAAVTAIAASAGWGRVVVVVERGVPRMLETTQSERLPRREDRPPG